ncbi:hypothetical protein GW17_00016729 [Ensete ventricosum]|nr:hypothetical protein GW17_00016729 [Ensete ventricosum]
MGGTCQSVRLPGLTARYGKPWFQWPPILDPELEFDREIYPLGLLPNIAVVVGVCQRMSFSACSEFPCFEPSPQAQTILHCLLRHLLQRDKSEEALRLACLSAEKPHFSHCLEWLLFTVFDAEISRYAIDICYWFSI